MKNKAPQLIIRFWAAAIISTVIYLLKPLKPERYIFFFTAGVVALLVILMILP